MGPFAAGQVVLLPFPFSDLSRGKLRPVLLLAGAGRGDWIVCQITSNPYADPLAMPLTRDAFAEGQLEHTSYLRPGKLFTASESLIAASIGPIHQAVFEKARNAVIAILQAAWPDRR